jgi:hypothetical protein
LQRGDEPGLRLNYHEEHIDPRAGEAHSWPSRPPGAPGAGYCWGDGGYCDGMLAGVQSWCECVDGECRERPARINAVRLRTPDGRYLYAGAGGEGRTRRLKCSAGPLGDLPLRGSNFMAADQWRQSCHGGLRLQLEPFGPLNSRLARQLSLLAGRHGLRIMACVNSCCVSRLGYAGHAGEWTFRLVKSNGNLRRRTPCPGPHSPAVERHGLAAPPPRTRRGCCRRRWTGRREIRC